MAEYWTGEGTLPPGKLCFVEGHGDGLASLYFAGVDDVTKVWGDDWDDAPYEANADRPTSRGDFPVWRVLADLGPWLVTPAVAASACGMPHSGLSADRVNAGDAYWLRTGALRWEPENIPSVRIEAGATSDRVAAALLAVGGTLFRAALTPRNPTRQGA